MAFGQTIKIAVIAHFYSACITFKRTVCPKKNSILNISNGFAWA